MKTYSIYMVPLFILITFFSCKKSDLITYEGKPALYFSIASVDSLSVNFSLLPDEKKDSVLKIPVSLLGKQLDADATFDVLVNGQVTTAAGGTDYELSGQFSMKAKKSTDTVRIKILRTAKLTSKAYVVGLELKPSAQFSNNLLKINNAKNQDSRVRIFITDILAPTKGWLTTSGKLGTDYYLGRFTKKKLQLVVKIFDFWTFQQLYDDIDQYPDYFGELLYDYLNEQRGAGTPVLEDDGTPMEAGIFFK
ncbi:DUF4843 domain-containing protein [Pedobacter africanus]|uniref:DUF4843 domain-containing protein n=1 Tax=Pedobacter africanus TaxID=151894 RepID=A0A1W2D9W0_9SPHI|nr:DUF4843 domain-containing protein [Pedobacter africanus]SMC94054.1 protein of unknown function [Pedobacter africanus]